MGDLCSPKNLTAVIMASNKLDGMDLRPDHEVTEGFDSQQMMAYEMMISKHLAGQNKKSPYDVEVDGAKERLTPEMGIRAFAKMRTFQAPSQTLGKKFFNRVADLHRAFDEANQLPEKSTAEDRAAFRKQYKKTVQDPTQKILNEMTDLATEARRGGFDIEPDLQERFGLKKENFWDAIDWLNWIQEGGPYRADKYDLLKVPARNLAGASARLNPTWTLGNVADVSRIIGAYADRPDVLTKGLKQTFKGGFLKGFQQTDTLKREGLYDTSEGSERGNFGNFDPFSWTTTLQKNLAWHLDKAAGGDGWAGVRENAFDYEAFDRAPIYRAGGAQHIFGLARFPIAEGLWHINTAKRALSGDVNAQINLATYFAAKSVVFGSRALVPAFLWSVFDDEAKEKWAEIEKAVPFFNLVGKGFDQVTKATGANTDTSFFSFAQPFGGSLGSRLQQIGGTLFTDLPTTSSKAVSSLAQGKADVALLNAAAAAIALANVAGLPAGMGKAEVPANVLLNNTTTRKVVKAWANSIEEKHSADRAWREIWKAGFGSSNVKKAEEKGGGNIIKGSFGSFGGDFGGGFGSFGK